MIYFIIFSLSFVFSFFLILLFLPLSKIINLLDKPDNKLKKHDKLIPLIGGVVLFIVFLVFYIISKVYLKIIFFENVFFISFIAIFILGIIDDYKRLSPIPKIIIESIIAIFLILNNFTIDIMIFPNIINKIITFFWIIGIMNAFNLMDIMDALSGSVSLIIALTLFFINLMYSNYELSYILLILIGFLTIFLFFNKPKAKIFLGDSGSLLIGFLLSIISIKTKYTSVNNIAFLTPILIFAIPIYDTFFVSIVRIIKRQNPLHGSPDHFAMKLNTIILRKGFVVFVIMLLQMLMSLFAYLSTIVNVFWAFSIYVFSFILLVEIGFYIYKLNYERE